MSLEKIYTVEHQLTPPLHQLSLEGHAVALLSQFLHSLLTLLLVFFLKTSTHLRFARPVLLHINIMEQFPRYAFVGSQAHITCDNGLGICCYCTQLCLPSFLFHIYSNFFVTLALQIVSGLTPHQDMSI